jgi:RNA polymerase sigma factor (sigma-70 family)
LQGGPGGAVFSKSAPPGRRRQKIFAFKGKSFYNYLVEMMLVILLIGAVAAWISIEEPGKIIGLKSGSKETGVLLEHYSYIASIVEYHAKRFDLDHDDALNFVLDKLSGNDYKKIRDFKGRSSFKTFITTVVARLIYTYGRKSGTRAKKLEELPCDVPDPETKNPLEFLIEIEETLYKEKALTFLPGILKSLSKQEQRVIRMKHEWELKISTIAKTLDISRYRLERILGGAEFKIKRQLDTCLAHNGSN